MANDRHLPAFQAIRAGRAQRSNRDYSDDGKTVPLPLPEGLEDAPLGTWCPLCGRRAAGRDLLLVALSVRGAEALGPRLVSVHPRCMRLQAGC